VAGRSNTRAGGIGVVRVDVKIDAGKASDDFKAARKQVDARLKEGLKTAGEKVALPEARRRAPVKTGALRASLIVKPRARDAVLTTRLAGKKARYVGLLEFGGTVRVPIEPAKKKALVVNGQPVARVDAPRHYKARRFLTGAVESKRPQIEQALLDETMKAFDGFDVE
jgi:HK97 gp10 family phage protein